MYYLLHIILIILGMQAQLWSETVRSKTHLHEMVFPRLIALAERAWHKGQWEYEEDSTK